MIIKLHSVKNFRNVESAEFEPDEELNIFYGENGQGKTNLIESVWLLTGFYSFRERKNVRLVARGKKEAEIKDVFFAKGREQNVVMKISGRKEIILNGIKRESPRAMTGNFFAVVFSPSTLGIVKGGPGERRRNLDVAVSLIKPNYTVLMSRYLRALNQRNALLKKLSAGNGNPGLLEPWNRELSVSGAKIVKYRVDYVGELLKYAEEIYSQISSGREKFSFYYEFCDDKADEGEIRASLNSELKKNEALDLKRLYTSSGPHSHDLILNLNGEDARSFASQGQQRSCALALKLAEAKIIERTTGERPTALLDDVTSELDENRQKFILDFLNRGQAFVTCCEPSRLRTVKKGKIFKVAGGKIKEAE